MEGGLSVICLARQNEALDLFYIEVQGLNLPCQTGAILTLNEGMGVP